MRRISPWCATPWKRHAQDEPRDRDGDEGSRRRARRRPQGALRAFRFFHGPKSRYGRSGRNSSSPTPSWPLRTRYPPSPTKRAPPSGPFATRSAAQKEDLIVATNEERMALRAELAQMAEAISTYKAELKRSTDTAMEGLRGQLDAFQLETRSECATCRPTSREDQGAEAAARRYAGQIRGGAGEALRQGGGERAPSQRTSGRSTSG